MRPDARSIKTVEVHCPKCGRAFLASKSETSLLQCCGLEYLVAVIYGHIFVEPIEEIYSEKEVSEIKEWRDNQ